MRVMPFRLLVGLLLPVDQRSFVTPLQQSGHRFPVGSREHKGFHRGFVRPDRARPVSVVSLAKQ